MLKKYSMHLVALIIFLWSTGYGIIIAQVHAAQLLKQPTPHATRVTHWAIPAEAVNDPYRLLKVWQNHLILNTDVGLHAKKVFAYQKLCDAALELDSIVATGIGFSPRIIPRKTT